MAMAVGSGGARISSCMTLKQVQERLKSAAQTFAAIIKSLLDLWLVLEDDPPKYLQHPQTVDAMRLVQAAVLQAPALVTVEEEQFDEARTLAWLQKHLPGISTAMQQSASSQLEIIIRRVSILQSLVHSQVQADCAQPSARVQNEQYTCLMVQAMADIFLTVAPVAALCEVLSSDSARTQHQTHHEQGHQKQRLQQGKELLGKFTRSLLLWEKAVRAPVQAQLCKLNDSWGQQGVSLAEVLAEGPAELQERIARLNYEMCMPAVNWLHMVSQLPPNRQANAKMGVIDWELLATAPISDALLAVGRRAFHNLLTRPNALKDLQRCVPPECVPMLLHAFTVTADDLQSLGVSAAQIQLLLPGSQETEPEVHLGQSSASRCSNMSWVGGAGEGSSGLSGAASADTSPGEASDECDDDEYNVDDMQALLRMMYGTTV